MDHLDKERKKSFKIAIIHASKLIGADESSSLFSGALCATQLESAKTRIKTNGDAEQPQRRINRLSFYCSKRNFISDASNFR